MTVELSPDEVEIICYAIERLLVEPGQPKPVPPIIGNRRARARELQTKIERLAIEGARVASRGRKPF